MDSEKTLPKPEKDLPLPEKDLPEPHEMQLRAPTLLEKFRTKQSIVLLGIILAIIGVIAYMLLY